MSRKTRAKCTRCGSVRLEPVTEEGRAEHLDVAAKGRQARKTRKTTFDALSLAAQVRTDGTLLGGTAHERVRGRVCFWLYDGGLYWSSNHNPPQACGPAEALDVLTTRAAQYQARLGVRARPGSTEERLAEAWADDLAECCRTAAAIHEAFGPGLPRAESLVGTGVSLLRPTPQMGGTGRESRDVTRLDGPERRATADAPGGMVPGEIPGRALRGTPSETPPGASSKAGEPAG
jgi:hypothetical protein